MLILAWCSALCRQDMAGSERIKDAHGSTPWTEQYKSGNMGVVEGLMTNFGLMMPVGFPQSSLFRLNAAHFTATASTLMLAYCSAMRRQAPQKGNAA